MPSVSGGVVEVGNTTAQVVASGMVVPVADASLVTVDVATYANPVEGADNLTTLVFPLDTAAFAIAIAGDVHPRWLLTSDGEDGLYVGDGTIDPYNDGAGLRVGVTAGQGFLKATVKAGEAQSLLSTALMSPAGSIVSGALPTVQLVSGVGQVPGAGSDVETITPVTFGSGVANNATCLVELSPDNITYSALGTETEPVGVALAGTVHLVKVRVPVGWYLRLTVTNATLGLTTHY